MGMSAFPDPTGVVTVCSGSQLRRKRQLRRTRFSTSLYAHLPDAARLRALESVEIAVIKTGEGMSDRSGDSSRSSSAR
jgi:hypothetical protein